MKDHEKQELRDRILKWTELYYPLVNINLFCDVLSRANLNPDAQRTVLEHLLDNSVLSIKPTGNFEVVSEKTPGFVLDPELDGKKLYFVSRKTCLDYEKALTTRLNAYNLSLKIHGKIKVPMDLTPEDWRVLRYRCMDRREEGIKEIDFMGILRRRKVLTSKRLEKYSVVRRKETKSRSQGRVVLNLRRLDYPRNLYYFFSQEAAEVYRESFPDPGALDIVKNQSSEPWYHR